MRQVDFFIVGMQKAGTTALDHMLRRHPTIQMASEKETHFFDNETLDWSCPDYGRLHALFDWETEARLRGEATPIYSYWPAAIERIRRYNPSAKLIVCLRHPSHRAYSHWRMERLRGWEELSFSEAIRDGRQRVRDAPGGVHRVHSYVERGFYAGQIRRLLAPFSPESVVFIRTDRLWVDPDRELGRICRFLGVESALSRAQRQYIVPLDTSDGSPMTLADRMYLDALFESGIKETARLTELDLGDWLRPNYRENMRPRYTRISRVIGRVTSLLAGSGANNST
jgi:hypothetical protein